MKRAFNVLIIDDDSTLREILRRCLIKLGCSVQMTDTAESGIEKLQSFRFDAVFASLCLHSLGGRAIARWIKNNVFQDMKFFITTSWKGELERDLLRFDGINDVIRKPFIFTEIRDKVLEHLG